MADAVVYRAMLDIQTAIQGAITGGTLVGISSGSVFIVRNPTDRNYLSSLANNFPGVLIATTGETRTPSGLNDRDEVIYQIVIAIVNNDNQSQAGNAGQSVTWQQELQWKQNISRLFHMKQLGPQTTESVKTNVRPLVTLDPAAWYANLWLCMLLVEAECREPRTQDAG
jgi:hypothetical protein